MKQHGAHGVVKLLLCETTANGGVNVTVSNASWLRGTEAGSRKQQTGGVFPTEPFPCWKSAGQRLCGVHGSIWATSRCHRSTRRWFSDPL